MTPCTIDELQTARMTCERLRPNHAGELYELLCDPRVSATLWPWPTPPSERDVDDGVRRAVEHWERYGFGLWLLRDRSTGAMVGRGGLQYTYTADQNAVEAAWAIVPDRWGQGLATELAQVALGVAFDELGLLEVVAFTLPHNGASRRVMEKTGFVYDRDVEHAGLPHVLYRRAR